jgi:hypothetical protein
MTGYLTKIIDRQLRRVTLATVLGIAVVTTTALAMGRFDHQNFGEAEHAVEKAQILLNDAACGVPGEKTTEACDQADEAGAGIAREGARRHQCSGDYR